LWDCVQTKREPFNSSMDWQRLVWAVQPQYPYILDRWSQQSGMSKRVEMVLSLYRQQPDHLWSDLQARVLFPSCSLSLTLQQIMGVRAIAAGAPDQLQEFVQLISMLGVTSEYTVREYAAMFERLPEAFVPHLELLIRRSWRFGDHLRQLESMAEDVTDVGREDGNEALVRSGSLLQAFLERAKSATE
jgi:hypothetical protein